MTSDGESFDSYVAAEGAALLRFAHVLTGDHHLAEDLVQEALVKAHRRWSRIDRPGAYVKKAVLRQYLSWRRRRSSGETPSDAIPDAPAPRTDHATVLAVGFVANLLIRPVAEKYHEKSAPTEPTAETEEAKA